MNRAVPRLAALALLGIMYARMLHAATLLSPVVDEQSHISRGLSVLRTGDLRLRIGHPIGLNVWEALPLALDPSVNLPLSHESWANAAWDRFGEQFLWRINANPDGIVFRSRVMVMLLTLVLGALVFRWAGELHGPRAGVLALALYSLDPNLLAHGMLATTDLGVTLFVFAATYALWRAVRVRQRRWLIAAGTLAGLALISKYSALLLIPTFAVLVGSLVIGHSLLVIGHWSLVIRHSSFVIIPALLTVAALYVFRLDLYLAEFSYLLAETQTHPSFLLGQRSIEGWWYYFLVTFFLKTPLPTLLFVAWAVMLGVARMRGRRGGATEVATTVGGTEVENTVGGSGFLLIPSLVYFGSSVLSGLNVGYRHLMPVLPFLLVYSSGVARIQHPRSTHIRFSSLIPHSFDFAQDKPSALIAALVLWLALSSFASHPDYIAYFNEAAPSPRHDVLVDSNLDWGQSLKQLRSYLDANAIDRVKLSYFGTAAPAAYGIDYDPLPRWPPPGQVDFVPANPAPGVYAISASNLQGILLDDPGVFDWFHRRDPDAVVGHTILVYHVAAEPKPPQSVGLCREPWTPVDDDEVDALFGRQGLRVVRFDCVNSWWWPDVPAWYIVPPADVDYRDDGITEYARTRNDGSVVFRVFRNDPPKKVARDPLDAPAPFEGGLTLLGFTWFGSWQPGGEFEVESAWRVDTPPTPPVSIFAHLLDPNGVFVTDADGFGIPAELLRPGDVMAQRHRFEVPLFMPAGEYTVEFGLYRLDTLERYSVLVGGKPVDQRVLAKPYK